MASFGKLPPLFPIPVDKGDDDASAVAGRNGADSPSSSVDESGCPLPTALSVAEKLPQLRDIIKSPTYLGTHGLSPGDTLEVDQDASTGASLKLELTGEVMRDGGNTLCLHCSASLPAPALPSKQRRNVPLSMADLLAGMPGASPATPATAATARPSSTTHPGGNSRAEDSQAAETSPQITSEQASEAVMITGQVLRLARGAPAPAPKQPVPNCFRTKYVGPYRIRILKVEVLSPPNTSPSPEMSPDSTLRDSHWYPEQGARLTSGLGSMSQPFAVARVAVDRIESRTIWRPPGLEGRVSGPTACIRCQHLPPGEECTLWLTTQSQALQQVSFGSSEDSFMVCLHVRPAPPEPPELRPVVEDEEDGEEDEAADLWEVELDMMRCGPVEAVSVIRLSGSSQEQEESRTVGDYRVTLARQVAPTCTPHRSQALLCRYPIILAHAELRVQRVSDGAYEDGLAGRGDGLSFLDDL
mmetsp:Transcript_11468/g.32533  ORF Transcript_11468/g.32533 Transcript_11468/m.32533 type:complete len:471 (-) Transcript_11468:87-1499(-)|eukprot:CAMPEP_0117660408 /NCGR_PEP_ID=MMETSP0804-20121206/6951_1 /TAXON_ID=1074897 /ORGANISM="Tetraselmis astigmatica, Strain CCMP880" /LENGTH=470 /DNA_ID=CAMNT_0005467133 /DNA_START=320 /DNA_END=1732 /DNA_ORIENTATION=+